MSYYYSFWHHPFKLLPINEVFYFCFVVDDIPFVYATWIWCEVYGLAFRSLLPDIGFYKNREMYAMPIIVCYKVALPHLNVFVLTLLSFHFVMTRRPYLVNITSLMLIVAKNKNNNQVANCHILCPY